MIVTVSPDFALVLLREILPLDVAALFTVLDFVVSTRVTFMSVPWLVPLLFEKKFSSTLLPLVRTGESISKVLFNTINLFDDVVAPS